MSIVTNNNVDNINVRMETHHNDITEKKSISLLLGAGFSAPQGYPIGSELNEKLLNCTGDDFAFSTDGILVINKDGGKPNFGYKNHYDICFDFCSDLMHYYNDNIKPFDYEEFYDYLKIEAKTDPKLAVFFKSKNYNNGRSELNDYLFKIENIFNQIVGYFLRDKEGKNRYDDVRFHSKPSFPDYTGFLDCMERFLKEYIVNVHTLNHDLFFERLNYTEWINGALCDGFKELGSPYYEELDHEGESYMCRLERYTGVYDNKLRLYKLHGSKDYYLYYKTEEHTSIPDTYIKTKGRSRNFYKATKDNDGKLIYDNYRHNYHPDFLTGTTAKIKRYKEPLLYKKLFDIFENNLKEADMLIIIGYGCKDSEINRILSENFKKEKPCYIVDPYAGDNVKKFMEEMGNNTKLITSQLCSLQISDFK